MQMRKMQIATALAGAMALSAAAAPVARGVTGSADAYDVVIYGGTAGGVAAAVQAARMGQRVALIEPGQHIGGMTSGGLSFTDTNWPAAVGGVSAEFYRRAARGYYGKTTAEWHFEPKVAEEIFEQMLRETSVTVYRGEALDLSTGVNKVGSRIESIVTESGRTIAGSMFIDASYEGDLMAKAGVSYTVGRESNDTYSERYNGVQTARAWSHQFPKPVDPYVRAGNPASGLLPGINPDPLPADGTGDHRVQAYNFRLTVTRDPDNKRPWTKPDNYDPQNYELLRRHIEANGITQVKGTLLKIDAIQGGKFDMNNQGAFSTDFIGASYAYPEADHATRAEIRQAHVDYQKGLLYFLATDPSLPQSIRDEMNSYGLTKDEFVDSDGWSHQLYVREARRMIGEYVMTDRNVVGADRVDVADPIGLGSYTMDSHNVQRHLVERNGVIQVRNEGDVQIGVSSPYGISYGAITPKLGEADNLLVPVALSASHIAYGSMRMEPVFMILGQSAATAAVQAMGNGSAVQQVDYATLAARLRADGQVLQWGSAAAATPFVGTLIENFDYGPDNRRVGLVSYIHGGWAEPWGVARDYRGGTQWLHSATPAYIGGVGLTYDAPGYVNSEPVGWLISGAARAMPGSQGAPIVTGRAIAGGMTGTIWLSALAQIDTLTASDRDVLIWLDRDANGNVDNAGDAFIGLRSGGVIQLRHSGSVNLFGDATYAAGVAHLLLARIDINADGSADALSFWIDPDLLDLGEANLSVSGIDLFGDSFDGIGLSLGAGGGMIDALRLSNLPDGFMQVTMVPEPISAGIVALAGLMLRRPRRGAKGSND